jgi:hypothetical protein
MKAYVLSEKGEILSIRKMQRDAIDDMDGLECPIIDSVEWVGADPLSESLAVYVGLTPCGEYVQASHDLELLDSDLEVIRFGE